MRKIPQIACQLSFVPIGDIDYNREIGLVLDMIAASGLTHEVGAMSTIIRGESLKVLALLGQIIQHEAESGHRYTMTAAISNTCGCSV
ncbi:MAG: Ykof family thiamine-binding protein [Oscillospiraceae bacterium]|nr:Ykof family thiamine-binding protein [Oscillospiraceae bacterium]